MLDFKNVAVAQERYADMRREAVQAQRNRGWTSDARTGAMQRVVTMVTNMRQRMVRSEAKAKPLGNTMPGELA
ncbi:MAG: hypothetical protein IAE81_19300 [Caldilineaceae bacterium]|jgi:hypothetical protein|nr:hypothetical protein [Caldilineaceae bacterium]